MQSPLFIFRKEAGSIIFDQTDSFDLTAEFLRNDPQIAREHYIGRRRWLAIGVPRLGDRAGPSLVDWARPLRCFDSPICILSKVVGKDRGPRLSDHTTLTEAKRMTNPKPQPRSIPMDQKAKFLALYNSELLTRDEVADRAKVTVRTVDNWTRLGLIPSL